MNLALEYLVRTKAIRNFFDAPSSLFLEKGDVKMVVTFDRIVGDGIRMKRWYITDDSVGRPLPHYLSFVIPRTQLFENPMVVPEGYYLVPYCEEPVDSSLNTYKKPMSAEVYNYFIENFLNSEPHQHFKQYWLWEAFWRYALSAEEREICSCRESTLLHFIQENGGPGHPWNRWSEWIDTLFPDMDAVAACELIFMA